IVLLSSLVFSHQTLNSLSTKLSSLISSTILKRFCDERYSKDMAYAALVSLSQVIEQILPHDQHYFLLCRKKQMNSLHENVLFLISFLEEFPAENGGRIINHLESRIRDAAYQVEDIIESYISTQIVQKYARGDTSSSLGEMHSAFGSCTEEVESIMEEAIKIKANSSKNEDWPLHCYTTTSTSRRAPSGKDSAVGLDEDLYQIKHRVAGQDSTLKIVPIIGMGGIGKTTLARNLYEDPLIVDYFHVRSWVTVSQEYNTQRILHGVLSNEGETDEDVELLIERVYKMLKGRRYLIVLDDMWHGEAWVNVRRAFPDDYNGSRVILTTRLSEVAAYVDPSSPLHRMQFLNEDQSWTLLRQKVFAKEERCPPKLKKIGKLIARNCKGLPLAIVVIAGLLQVNKTRHYWKNVAKDVNAADAAATSNDDQFSGILSLSYNNLPHRLKACFLYMGVYPEDYVISTNQLFKLWVAEGFLNPVGPKNLEEVAEEYLEDLVERSLVMVNEKKSSGKIRTCSIHDHLRELCLRKAQEEKFVQHFKDRYVDKFSFPQIIKNQRRISIHTDNLDSLKDDVRSSPVRSLMYFGSISGKLLPFTSQFMLLRVVDRLLVKSKFFPLEIFELVNLRYLAFIYNYNGKCSIPASISKLGNLQTLIVVKGSSAKYDTCQLFLPSEIWNMRQLRHLVLMRSTILLSYCDGVGESDSVLDNLQTLSKVLNFKFTKQAIERLLNLKKLRIHYRDFDQTKWSEFHLENLVHLHQLEELTFRFHAGYAPIDQFPLPKDLAFPKNLKKITLIRSGIPWKKMSAIGSLPNLEVLKLRRDSFVGWKWEPVEGEFPRLKCLEMFDINLRIWSAESTHLPCLEKLSISWCTKLKEVPLSIGDIPTLQTLIIERCNMKA
ncbi:hypothetical protein Pfo_020306, partial [Paulownia fortunei]